MSTLCSFAILRTRGEERWRIASSVVAARGGGAFSSRRPTAAGGASGRAGGGAGAAAGVTFACGSGFGGSSATLVSDVSDVSDTWGDTWATAGAARLASPAAPITATTLLTATVSPSCARISETTPAAGEGISASTLSVEISNSGSSRSTVSPTFLIQRTIVPSAIDSPICGITTSVGIKNLQLVSWRFGELVNSDSVILQFSNSPIHQFTNSPIQICMAAP